MSGKTNRTFSIVVIMMISILFISQVFGKLAESNNNKSYSKNTLESLLSKSDQQFWNNIKDWWERTVDKINDSEKTKNVQEKIISWFKKW